MRTLTTVPSNCLTVKLSNYCTFIYCMIQLIHYTFYTNITWGKRALQYNSHLFVAAAFNLIGYRSCRLLWSPNILSPFVPKLPISSWSVFLFAQYHCVSQSIIARATISFPKVAVSSACRSTESARLIDPFLLSSAAVWCFRCLQIKWSGFSTYCQYSQTSLVGPM